MFPGVVPAPMPMPMPMPAAMPVGPMPGPFPGPMAMPMGGGPMPGVGGGGGVGGIVPPKVGGQGQGLKKAVAATRKRIAGTQDFRHEMRERMRYIMYEIDESNGRFLSSRQEPFQFLDVCCCPGGFSTYSLTAGPAPRKGIGLSLPPDLGGHLPAIEQETDKYYMHFVDVTTVAAGVRVADMGVGVPGCPKPALRLNAALTEPPTNRCHLVILDGSFLGGKDWIHKETSLPDSENPAFNVYGTNAAAHKALLVAQLIVMANNLAPGGLLVLRLNMFPDLFTIGVLGLLRHVFRGDVMSYKPRSCHVHVGSYYLVCTGFDPQAAYCMQWVPRWCDCLAALRSGGPAPKCVPFPGLQLDNPAGMHLVWTRPMYTYHVHLWRFLKLVEAAMEDKAMLDRRMPDRPRTGRFTNSCGKIFAGVPCSGRCNSAHLFEELHPFVQKAFREPRGFLFLPGSLPLLQAPIVPYDPLPEALLELRQQAHLQAVLQAQAAAASQRAALEAATAAAAASGGGGNLLGHVGTYDNAVELGMAGEWVHGLMRDPRDAEEAGEDALQLFMRAHDDENVVLEGGFDEEPPPFRVPHPGGGTTPPRPLAAATPAVLAASPPTATASVADEASSAIHGADGAGASVAAAAAAAAAAVTREADWEFAATAETAAASALPSHGKSGGVGGGGAAAPPPIRADLLRMSGYQPRLTLVTVEVADDESRDAMLDFLGR